MLVVIKSGADYGAELRIVDHTEIGKKKTDAPISCQ